MEQVAVLEARAELEATERPAVDKRMTIGDIRLEYKAGGRSGVFRRG